MFTIYGTYRGKKAEIDTADTRQEADRLATEYRLAFGSAWIITIKGKD